MISAVRAAPKSGFLGVRLGCGDIHALKRCFILTTSLSLLLSVCHFILFILAHHPSRRVPSPPSRAHTAPHTRGLRMQQAGRSRADAHRMAARTAHPVGCVRRQSKR